MDPPPSPASITLHARLLREFRKAPCQARRYSSSRPLENRDEEAVRSIDGNTDVE